MNDLNFDAAFAALTRNPPFPWQQNLYHEWFAKGKFPSSCNLATGLGKTSVVAIWLIALANHPDIMPRRLVYVVNRRTVVDQTTNEVERIRDNLLNRSELAEMKERLGSLALSTLRGQFADNREWSADPSRPAVICGTVDMIGSRLLFSGYGIGFKGKPLHAGFLGQDALLVHDEAHLEPAFQELLLAIEKEQRDGEKATNLPWPKFRVLELTATPRGGGKVFELTEREKNPDEPIPDEPSEPIHHVWRRNHGSKALGFHRVADEKKQLVPKIAEIALDYEKAEAKPAVLIFVRTVQAVDEVVAALKKGKVDPDNIETLTGTMRGLERELMAIKSGVFARFMRVSPAEPRKGTVYLVCTSAGEVGVDMSADHLICDLSTYDSIAQRFGRVNRYGYGTARIDVIHPAAFDTKDKPLEIARERCLQLLGKLRRRADNLHDASPAGLSELLERTIHEASRGSSDSADRTKALREHILSAFAPPPTILPVTDILFDTWALTTIKGGLPGRPPVEEYLHGMEEKEQYNTTFAWREEVALLADVEPETLGELLDEFPLKPHEKLRIPTFGKRSAFDQLEAIAEREVAGNPQPAWVIEPDGELKVYASLKVLLKKNGKDYAVSLASRTVVLPPKAGGLTNTGMLDGKTPHSDAIKYDVAGTPPPRVGVLLRLKLVRREDEEAFVPVAQTNSLPPDYSLKALPKTLKPTLRIDLDRETGDGAVAYVIVREPRKLTATAESEWPALERHLNGVRSYADAICARLKLDPKLAEAVSLAAAYHDLGKGRPVWQRGAGNKVTNGPVAKTLHGRAPENLNRFRHELGSMVDAVACPEFAERFYALDDHQRELVLHLIATHHGRGRPHFPAPEAFDNDHTDALVAAVIGEVPSRFARLQREYGRWGLAYLESLLRAADALESRRIEAAPLADSVPGKWPQHPQTLLPYGTPPLVKPTISVAVDPTSPGQFFACCGLLELADRLWPGAEGWFAQGGRDFYIACAGTLQVLLARTRSLSFDVGDDSEAADEKDDNLPIEPICLFWEDGKPAIDLDWWRDKSIKPWAGSMKERVILRAMLDAINPECKMPFDDLRRVFYQSQKKTKKGKLKKPAKKEPFYFDPRRGNKSHPLDCGFSPDTHKMESDCCPALEALCFIGLQRARPAPTGTANQSRYTVWPMLATMGPGLPVSLVGAVVAGIVRFPGSTDFVFDNYFRTDQRKHKTFSQANPERSNND